jgi:hypothetical protein
MKRRNPGWGCPGANRTISSIIVASMSRSRTYVLQILVLLAREALAQTSPALAFVDTNVVDLVEGAVRSHQTVLAAAGRISDVGAAETIKVPIRLCGFQPKANFRSRDFGICMPSSERPADPKCVGHSFGVEFMDHQR